MTVYIVHDYADYSIVGVFATEAAADEASRRFTAQGFNYSSWVSDYEVTGTPPAPEEAA